MPGEAAATAEGLAARLVLHSHLSALCNSYLHLGLVVGPCLDVLNLPQDQQALPYYPTKDNMPASTP